MTAQAEHAKTGAAVKTRPASRTRRLVAWFLRSRSTARIARGDGIGLASDRSPNGSRPYALDNDYAANAVRARRASEDLVRAGFNTGAVPYGYRSQRIRVAPPGRRPRMRTRLMIEPVEATVVKMIFLWRVHDGLTDAEIRARLAASRYPAPLDRDTGQPVAWTNAIVRAILRNPKYLGRQVWGCRHHGRPTPPARWVWSHAWAHPPVITADEFAAANPRAATPPVADNDHAHTERPAGLSQSGCRR